MNVNCCTEERKAEKQKMWCVMFEGQRVPEVTEFSQSSSNLSACLLQAKVKGQLSFVVSCYSDCSCDAQAASARVMLGFFKFAH